MPPLLALLSLGCAQEAPAPLPRTEATLSGPLRVHPENPRYFADAEGRAVYLTGSHTWDNFQDWADAPPFDYEAYLELLVSHNHNFMRLWTWEDGLMLQAPYQRTGPGTANDGRPKFDLDRFDESYFDRLRERVLRAQERGIYVAIMLFQHHGEFELNFYNGANNVSGVDAASSLDLHTLADPAITERQRAYVRKVVDAVNDLDNVMYEIGNEHQRMNLEWVEAMVREIRTYQQTKPQQHLVGISASGHPDRITNADLFASTADWVGPSNEPGQSYAFDPPVATGEKIVVADQDHIAFILGTTDEDVLRDWVWTSFTRGIHPITMEAVQNAIPVREPGESWNDTHNVTYPAGRYAMGLTRAFAARLDLARTVPSPDACSTGYCLVDPGRAYLVYVPERESDGVVSTLRSLTGQLSVTVDLTAAAGPMCLEWVNASTGAMAGGRLRMDGGKVVELSKAFRGAGVAFLYRADETSAGPAQRNPSCD